MRSQSFLMYSADSGWMLAGRGKVRLAEVTDTVCTTVLPSTVSSHFSW